MKRRDLSTSAIGGAASLAMPHIARAQGKRTINFVPQADLALLNPVFDTALVTRNHGFLVDDQLYGLDGTLNPQPQMVEGHVVADDGRTWKMTLRDGLKFHDGTPVLARDAVASIDRWSRNDPFGQNVRAVTDEMTAPSDRVIQFRLKKPFPLLPVALAKSSSYCPVLPERLAKTPPNQQVTDMTGSRPSTWWKFGWVEVAADHAATVEIWVAIASISGGVSSAIASVCI